MSWSVCPKGQDRWWSLRIWRKSRKSKWGLMDDHLALQDLHGAVLFETASNDLLGTETEVLHTRQFCPAVLPIIISLIEPGVFLFRWVDRYSIKWSTSIRQGVRMYLLVASTKFWWGITSTLWSALENPWVRQHQASYWSVDGHWSIPEIDYVRMYNNTEKLWDTKVVSLHRAMILYHSHVFLYLVPINIIWYLGMVRPL